MGALCLALAASDVPERLEPADKPFFNPGDQINVEYDLWAKAFVNYQEQRTEEAQA